MSFNFFVLFISWLFLALFLVLINISGRGPFIFKCYSHFTSFCIISFFIFFAISGCSWSVSSQFWALLVYDQLFWMVFRLFHIISLFVTFILGHFLTLLSISCVRSIVLFTFQVISHCSKYLLDTSCHPAIAMGHVSSIILLWREAFIALLLFLWFWLFYICLWVIFSHFAFRWSFYYCYYCFSSFLLLHFVFM